MVKARASAIRLAYMLRSDVRLVSVLYFISFLLGSENEAESQMNDLITQVMFSFRWAYHFSSCEPVMATVRSHKESHGAVAHEGSPPEFVDLLSYRTHLVHIKEECWKEGLDLISNMNRTCCSRHPLLFLHGQNNHYSIRIGLVRSRDRHPRRHSLN